MPTMPISGMYHKHFHSLHVLKVPKARVRLKDAGRMVEAVAEASILLLCVMGCLLPLLHMLSILIAPRSGREVRVLSWRKSTS